jgi:colanic acid/amylovoran biosynthesis glycosyltransferase
LFSLFNPLTFTAQAALRKAYWDLPVFLLNQHYDIIHCHFGFNGRKVAHLKKLGILTTERCIVSFHGSDLTPSKVMEYRELYQALFAYFDAFTVNTPHLEAILKTVQSDLPNVYILPVGFNEAYLKPFLDLPKSTVFTIVYCGRLMGLKGPDQALQILAGLVKQGLEELQLLMIGEGDELLHLKAQAHQLGIAEKVRWLGVLSQEEVFKAMSTSHVFLYPGRTEAGTGRAETQGLVIQEAQYLKLPVVVADVGGVKHGIQNHATGFVIAENDMDGFVEKIKFLKNNLESSKRIGTAGHLFVKKYEIKELNNKIIKLYQNQNCVHKLID